MSQLAQHIDLLNQKKKTQKSTQVRKWSNKQLDSQNLSHSNLSQQEIQKIEKHKQH